MNADELTDTQKWIGLGTEIWKPLMPNSVIVGGNIPFWRYVNADNPANNNAIWKSVYGDELSDDDVTKI